jgi:AbrB family looped-hinge helix DNA binding protein
MNKMKADNLELTVVSSKGQLVLPKDIRDKMHIKEGSVLAVTAYPEKDVLVFKTIKKPQLQEDVMIIKETEKAWKDIEEGKFKTESKADFLKKLKDW